MFLAKKAFSAFIPLNRFERSAAIQLWPNRAGVVVNCTAKKSNVYNRLQYSRVLLRKGRISDYQVAQTLFQSEAKSEEIVMKML